MPPHFFVMAWLYVKYNQDEDLPRVEQEASYGLNLNQFPLGYDEREAVSVLIRHNSLR